MECKRIMKRFLFFSTIVLFLALVSFPASAVTHNASDMAVGTWSTNPRYITFGSYNGYPLLWRVLEVKDNDSDFGGIKTAFLLLDDLLRETSGDVEMIRYDFSSNNFPKSYIKKWLNDEENGFLACLGTYQPDILEVAYGADNSYYEWHGGTASGDSKVFLLSVGEADNVNYFAGDAERAVNNIVWWLRSPGFEDEDIATGVLSTGGVGRNACYVGGMCAVRPALKISISSSSAFASFPISYGVFLNVNDEGNPVSGAKLSLTLSEEVQSTENFTNSFGIVRFSSVLPGEYTFSVSKPGYVTKSELIAVPSVSSPSISLTKDLIALPDIVEFGKYNGAPIEWKVLDIVNGKALLFAGALFLSQFDMNGGNEWEKSSLRAQLNGIKSGDFLQESNFTVAEVAAIDSVASAVNDAVFILSVGEVQRYLPDLRLRFFDNKEWLTRTPSGIEDVEVITADGDFGDNIEAFDEHSMAWVRPAMWVDLSILACGLNTNILSPTSKEPEIIP